MTPQPDQTPATIILRHPRRVRGLIAVFDVLGFRSFCENNSDPNITEEVLKNIDLVPEGMAGLLSTAFGANGNPEAARKLVLKIEWLVFSDTILAILPNAEMASRDMLTAYLVACATLNRVMFDRGLPIRGSVHLGDFLLGNRSIAGRVLVQALDQVRELEAACTAISCEVWVMLQERFQGDDTLSSIFMGMLPRYPIRCKSGVRTIAALNWFNVRIGDTPNPQDMQKYVMDCFLDHGKQLDASAFAKARDTVELFNKFTTRPKPEGDSTKSPAG